MYVIDITYIKYEDIFNKNEKKKRELTLRCTNKKF